MRNRDPRKGFTLVEVLVVLAISALLAGIALTYNNASRKEIALTVEAAKISQFILRAESLSIATYGDNSGMLVCGYGMRFDNVAQSYSIFQYEPVVSPGQTCRDVALELASTTSPRGIATAEMQPYTAGTWNIGVAPEVRVGSSTAPDSIGAILFFPPAPTTYISRDYTSAAGGTFLAPTLTSKVYLQTADGTDARVITVNPAGQVSL